MSIQKRLTSILTDSLSPLHLEVENESHKHQGHMGDNGSGESHFRVLIVSPAFTGKSRLERQRMVFSALGDLMKHIHALSVKALPPEEYQA